MCVKILIPFNAIPEHSSFSVFLFFLTQKKQLPVWRQVSTKMVFGVKTTELNYFPFFNFWKYKISIIIAYVAHSELEKKIKE